MLSLCTMRLAHAVWRLPVCTDIANHGTERAQKVRREAFAHPSHMKNEQKMAVYGAELVVRRARRAVVNASIPAPEWAEMT